MRSLRRFLTTELLDAYIGGCSNRAFIDYVETELPTLWEGKGIQAV